jgi:PAS domain S-box-containing protein
MSAHSARPAAGLALTETKRARARAVISKPHRHAVQFYESEEYLANLVVEFVAAGFRHRNPAIIIATEAHRETFSVGLSSRGLNGQSARDAGELVLLDARDTLAGFMRNGMPDRAAFRSSVGVVAERLARRHGGHLRAYGEMVNLLWEDGNPDGAVALEELWNELGSELDFSLLCAYAMPNFSDASHGEQFERICATHTHVLPMDRFIDDDGSQFVEMAILQQRAQALETEVRRRESIERQLRATVAQLSDREAELRDVLENATEGIHCVGVDGIIKWANATELAMLGYAEREYVGHHVAEFHVDEKASRDMLTRLSRGETLADYAVRLRCKDGSTLEGIMTSNSRFRAGEIVYVRCFTRDMTQINRAAEERERLLQRERAARADAERAKVTAEHANRAKSQFLAVMSHELRTPLNAIGGYAELIEMEIHGPVTHDQRDALDRIQRSQRHLLGLINQVLNYARIETGSLRYDIRDFSFDELLQTVEALSSPQFAAKGLAYVYAPSKTPVIIRADREKVQQILLNLLNNACKFTGPGGRVMLEYCATASRVLVRVADTGIGISPEKRDVIFEPFVQVDTNYTRTKDGVGLGLAISRDLARAMGGDLTVESNPGQGSTFTLALPRAG